MSLVPYVIEQTSRGERSYDIYSRLLKERKPGSRSGNRERTDGYSGSNDRVPGKTDGR